MSSGGFIKRWSRRKQGADGGAPAEGPEEAVSPSPPPPDAEEPIDPATLPPIESLGADSDYTIFLKKGVPEALRLAALRKAWMSDTFIRDFRSPAIDYGWDFTTPEYSLRPTDDVAKLLDGIFGSKPPPAETLAPAPSTASAGAASAPPAGGEEPVRASPAEKLAAPQLPQYQAVPAPPFAEPLPAVVRRKHGGALPD